MVDGFHLALGVPYWKLRARPIDQIVKIFLGVLERRAIGLFAVTADEEIGVESGLEREHFNVEFFFDQQSERALGGSGPGSIGVEVEQVLVRA